MRKQNDAITKDTSTYIDNIRTGTHLNQIRDDAHKVEFDGGNENRLAILCDVRLYRPRNECIAR